MTHDTHASRRWPIVAAVAIAALGLVIALLPYEASGNVVTVKCGNAFKGIGGGPDRLEITQGFEEARGLSAVEVQAELAEAADACESEATVRLVLGAALFLAALLGAVVGPRILARRRGAPHLEP